MEAANSSYDNRMRNGVSIGRMPVLNSYSGTVRWVRSSAGSNGDGSFKRPFATVDAAINASAAGDILMVKDGHAETVAAAAGIDADVAGISIIGMGNGRRRPTVTFATATTADMDIDAANITIENFVFDCTGIDALVAPIDVNAADFRLASCEIIFASATAQATEVIVTATAADRMKVLGNTFTGTTDVGANNVISIEGTPDGIEIGYNYVDGDFADACIHNPTGNVATNLKIYNNYLRNRQAADHALELVSACTGYFGGNTFVTDAIATAADLGALMDRGGNFFFDSSDTDAAATPYPETVTTGGHTLSQIADRLGADADTNAIAAMLGGGAGIATYPAALAPANGVNVFEVLRDIWDAVRNGTGGSEPGTNKSVVDAIGFDGAAAVAASAGMLRTANGTTFIVKKTLTSSAVVQAGVDVTAVSTVGDILIEDWTIQADATGLAAGTNFTLETNNAKGSAIFCSNAVSGLGANTLVDRKTATTGKNVVLESGKKIIAKCTVADCTGSGTVDVYLLCRRLADNATLAAA